MQARLILVEGRATKSKINLRLPVRLGRSPKADVRIQHPLVSRRHCELFERDGELVVRDTGSSNGTFVNGEKIDEAVLNPGTRLTIGPLTFEAAYESAVAKTNGHSDGESEAGVDAAALATAEAGTAEAESSPEELDKLSFDEIPDADDSVAAGTAETDEADAKKEAAAAQSSAETEASSAEADLDAELLGALDLDDELGVSDDDASAEVAPEASDVTVDEPLVLPTDEVPEDESSGDELDVALDGGEELSQAASESAELATSETSNVSASDGDEEPLALDVSDQGADSEPSPAAETSAVETEENVDEELIPALLDDDDVSAEVEFELDLDEPGADDQPTAAEQDTAASTTAADGQVAVSDDVAPIEDAGDSEELSLDDDVDLPAIDDDLPLELDDLQSEPAADNAAEPSEPSIRPEASSSDSAGSGEFQIAETEDTNRAAEPTAAAEAPAADDAASGEISLADFSNDEMGDEIDFAATDDEPSAEVQPSESSEGDSPEPLDAVGLDDLDDLDGLAFEPAEEAAEEESEKASSDSDDKSDEVLDIDESELGEIQFEDASAPAADQSKSKSKSDDDGDEMSEDDIIDFLSDGEEDDSDQENPKADADLDEFLKGLE